MWQSEFWKSLRDLEEELGFEIDASRDLEEWTVASLRAENRGREIDGPPTG